MKNPATIAGLVVAAAALGVASLFYSQKESAETKLADLEIRESASGVDNSVAVDVNDASGDADTVDELKSLREELATAQAHIESLEASADALEEAPDDAESEEAESEEDEKLSFEDILERIRSSPQASAQMLAITEMTYSDLFNSLELDPEAKAALRDMLVDSQISQAAFTGYAVRQGDVTGRELARWENEEHDRLAGDVSELLDGDDYEAWDDYASTLDERVMRASLQNQIPAFASGLTQESLDIVLDVAVEEFVNEQDVIRHSDDIYTPQEPMLFQLRALETVNSRLQDLLSPEQLREYQNFESMANNLLERSMPKDEDTP